MDLNQTRILDLVPAAEKERSKEFAIISPSISAFLFPKERFPVAKAYWQHTGDGISSRRAEYCYDLLMGGVLVDETTLSQKSRLCKGPKRYQRKTSADIGSPVDGNDSAVEMQDHKQFVEERFGRNLDISLTANAKLAVRRRIAGSLTADVDLAEALAMEKDLDRTRKVWGFSEDDVYLYPGGMNAIFNTHQNMLAAKGQLKSIVYG